MTSNTAATPTTPIIVMPPTSTPRAAMPTASTPVPPNKPVATAPETPLRDVMGGASRIEIKVLDHGFVALVDSMPRLVPEGQTGDQAIVQAARVSYGQGTKQVNEDRGLIRYLMRHRHTTPLEM